MFEVGKLYHRQSELHDKYGGNRQSGIASCSQHPIVFLFSSPRGEEFGYTDGVISETEYLYTGEGQVGDMAMTRGNLAIRDHDANGKELHVFEKQSVGGYYRYIGRYVYASHERHQGRDVDSKQRQVIVFRLRKD